MRRLLPTRPGRRRDLRFRRPLVGVVALVLACGLAVAACSGSSEPAVPPELVWAVGEIDARPRGPATEVARMWNDRYPDRPRVRVHALPGGADDQRQVMAVELNAGLAGFDVLTLDVIWTGEFAENGWLAELKGLRSTVDEVSLDAPVQSATWDGRLWAAPYTSDAAFLFYRKDLGLGEPPRTWEELKKVAIAAAGKEGIEAYVAQGAQYEGMVVNFLEYLWGAGGELFDADGTDVEFDGGPAHRALEFMQKSQGDGFYAEGFETMKEDESQAAFQRGEAVFMRNWPHVYPGLQGEDEEHPSMVVGKFDIASLPTLDGEGTTPALGGSNLAVSRFSRNRKWAEDFVTFASTDRAVQRALAKTHARGPALASVYDDKDLRDDPVMKLRGEVLKSARARPTTPDWSAISDAIQRHVYPAYTAGRELDAALAEIRSFLELTTAAR